jgi:hypothetical protein
MHTFLIILGILLLLLVIAFFAGGWMLFADWSH